MALRAFSAVFLSCESTLSDENRALDNLIEGDLRVSSNSHPFDTPKQSYIQSMVSRLDWYKTGSAGCPFSGFSDFGAEFGIPDQKRDFSPALTSGGNVVFSKVSPPSTPHSPTAMKLEPYGSRKRSLDSTVSDTDDFQIPDRTALRRRIA